MWCVFNFSKKGRFRLAVVFCILNAICVVVGVFLTVHAVYVHLTFAPNFYSENAEVTFVFVVSAIFGTHIVMQFLTGMKIAQKCYLQPQKKSTNRLLFLWLIFGANTILNLLILAYLHPQISTHIEQTVRFSLEKCLTLYLKDNECKYNLDRIQLQMKCCGVDDYNNWLQINWLNKYVLNENSQIIKQLRADKEELVLPVVPWSCCRPEYPMQCFHDPLQQIESIEVWTQPDVVLSSINVIGCLNVLLEPVRNSLNMYTAATVLIFILFLIIFCVARLLFTSSRNAVLLREEELVSPGWIFGGTKRCGIDELCMKEK